MKKSSVKRSNILILLFSYDSIIAKYQYYFPLYAFWVGALQKTSEYASTHYNFKTYDFFSPVKPEKNHLTYKSKMICKGAVF